MSLKAYFIAILFITPASSLFAANCEVAPGLHKKITTAQTAISQQQWDKALKLLKPLSQQKLSRCAKGRMEQALIYTWLGKNKLQTALKLLKTTVKNQSLALEVRLELRRLLAEVEIRLGHYQSGLKNLQRWMKQVDTISIRDHLLASKAYEENQQYQKASEHLAQLIAQSPNPEPAWTEKLLLLQIKTGVSETTQNPLQHLQDLVGNNPAQIIYWRQLSNAYLQQKNYAAALACLWLAHRAGITESTDIEQLIQLSQYLQQPWQALQVLEQAMTQGTIDTGSQHQQQLLTLKQQARNLQPNRLK
ncbi:tetratricopeptide repeat protein [Candidatus Venteria ishoeyi]|uniref:Tetratricopeptide repeat protein n=2 Tax=Candidatus Venteria ishoeyi TaxID=1899563 RepID=A0A1H6FEG5_9GAMM|nr:hypothetical protein [Candidatus Venteria ishoeyi]SEH07556.1 Tetratricopeptide repeat protein [Candidatus Venteria ishoeyi]